MDEKKSKLSNEWIRCQSKSRKDRYYLFNTRTAETKWCASDEGTDHLKTVAAKNVTKTPAQDRLKRLQNQLEKKRAKEVTAERTKNERVPKKEKTKDTANGNPSPSRGIHEKPKVLSRKESHASPRKDTIVSPSSSKHSSISSVQKRLLIAAKKSSEKPSREKSKPKERTPSEINEVPTISAVKAPVEDKPVKETQPQVPEKSQISFKDVPVEYDENKNQKKSGEKSGFLSKIKGFCSNLLSGPSKGKRKSTDGEKLSATSKPHFKHKKHGDKELLRGISSETIQNSKTNSVRSPDKPPQVVLSFSVPKESANDRLARLRKSLKEHQALQPPPSIPRILHADSIRSLNDSECEPMDWQPTVEDDMINSPSTSSGISADLSTVSEHNDTVSENITRLVSARRQSKVWKRDHFHFVIDTNVFIEHPTFVEDLTTMKLCDTKGTVIYIPYCVLQELDKLKIRSPSESVRLRTGRAIKLLNKAFEERNPQFQAQSAADEGVHLIKVTSPDDSILNCCLQVKQHVDNLLLLTEDVNLQSKAMCNDILVSTKSDLISLH